jgi:NAD(P)-dependent dehydrogenase (short-subunit alcohol dehydrogenase family)
VSGSPVALVTGGAAGIGRALVRRLGSDGYRVVVVDRDAAGAEAAAALVDGHPVSVDLTDPAGSGQAVEAAMAKYGRLDVACLNAGIATGTWDVEQIAAERYRQVLSLNQDAVFWGVQAVVPALRQSGGGAIVATASLGGLIGQADDPVYCMTKHAVVGLVRSLALPLQTHGIRIVALCPGFVDTPLLAPYLAAFQEAKFPLLVPDDVAEAATIALAAGGTGEAWVVQPGRAPEPYRFRGVPGPRVDGYDGAPPPAML